MAIDDLAKKAAKGGESEIRYLTQIDIETKSEEKFCRFKSMESNM